MAWIKLNATTPAAPEGERNVHFRQEVGHAGTQSDPIPTSAFAPEVPGVIEFGVDGGASTPAIGTSQRTVPMPYAGTITLGYLVANEVGTLEIDIRKCALGDFPDFVSIVGATPPALDAEEISGGPPGEDWIVEVQLGDIFEFEIIDSGTLKRFTLCLYVARA